MTAIQFDTPPQRILIVKPSAIGDVVHALPILNLLRKKWPASTISWLVTPACEGLLIGHPQLDEVIRFERRHFGSAWRRPTAAVGLVRFFRDLKQRNFDLVIDLQGLFRSGWITWRTRAPVRVGFANAREFAPIFYTHRVPIHTMDQHAIERYLSIAEALGCGRAPVEFQFAIDDDDRASIRAMLGDDIGDYAVLLPGANWQTKRWPIEKFAKLAQEIRSRMNLKIITAGGPDDVALCSNIESDVNLSGKTSLRQVVALLERASLVVANDSGPMHIAAALNRPLIVPFGPTNPIRTGPFGRVDECVVKVDIPCSPCYSRTCSHQSCLKWLEVEPVVEIACKWPSAANGQ